MARIIEEVAILLGVETKGADREIAKTDKKVKRLNSTFKKLGATMAAAFGARALFNRFRRTITLTDELARTAKGVGFTVNEYGRLVFALDQVGVKANSARIALGDFQKRLAKPQFHKFFRQAGLDPKELQKLSPSDAFDTAFTHLATLVDDPRAAGFFGTIFEEQAGKDMLKAARQMPELLAARARFEERVGKLTDRQVQQIKTLQSEIKVYTKQWEVLNAQVVADVAPELLATMKELEDAGAFKDMANAIKETVAEINLLIGDIKYLGEVLHSLPIPEWMRTLARWSFNPVGTAARAPMLAARSVRTPAPDLSAWTRGTNAERGGAGPQTIVNQTNNFNIDKAENARLNKAWRKLNDQHQRAGGR